jgi:hypothetical protein
MDIRDCFLMDKNNDIAKDVAYWKRRAYRPVRSDVVKWYIFKNFLSFPRKNMILAMGGTTAFMTENRKNFKVMSMERGLFSKKELIKNHIDLMPVNYWYWKFICAMETDEQKAEKYAQDMAKVMKRMNPQVIILRDMHSAFHRSLAYAAHKADIPVVYYEHGANERDEHSVKFERAFTREMVDYFWYWSKKNVLKSISLGLAEPNNAFAIGYPYYYDTKTEMPSNRKKVLFAGTKYKKEMVDTYYDMVEKIYLYCRENEIEFTYRHHSHEGGGQYGDRLKRLKDMGVQFSENTLRQELNDNYIVVGVSTSVIFEAALYGDFVIHVVLDYETQKAYIFDDTYQTPDADGAIELIQKAVDGELEPKKLNKDNLMYGELAPRTKEAVEKIRSDWKNR